MNRTFIRGEKDHEASHSDDSMRGNDCRRRGGLGPTVPGYSSNPAAPDGVHDDVPLYDGDAEANDPGANEADAGMVAVVPYDAATAAGPAPTEKVNWTMIARAVTNLGKSLEKQKHRILFREKISPEKNEAVIRWRLAMPSLETA